MTFRKGVKRTTDYDDHRPVDSSKARHMRASTVVVWIDTGESMEISGAPTAYVYCSYCRRFQPAQYTVHNSLAGVEEIPA